MELAALEGEICGLGTAALKQVTTALYYEAKAQKEAGEPEKAAAATKLLETAADELIARGNAILAERKLQMTPLEETKALVAMIGGTGATG